MELPYFKAFPTDWEIAMRKAGIPTAKRGTVYRLIFFAWQEQGLNLTEDETYERRTRALAQAFGMSYCRFLPYLAYYKSLSECHDGLWLPSFLLQQLHRAMQSWGNSGAKSEQGQSKAGTESEQSQNRVRTESEQLSAPKSNAVNTPFKHEQEHKQEQRESTRAREEHAGNHTERGTTPHRVKAAIPESPLDDFSDPLPERTYSVGERFVLKACGLWDTVRAEVDLKTRDAVREAAAYVTARIRPQDGVGGSPDLFQVFWFDVLGRSGNPRPQYVIEQWTAYDRWLVQNHETHRTSMA